MTTAPKFKNLSDDPATTGLPMSLIEAAHELLEDSHLLDGDDSHITFNFETEMMIIYNKDEIPIAWRNW